MGFGGYLWIGPATALYASSRACRRMKRGDGSSSPMGSPGSPVGTRSRPAGWRSAAHPASGNFRCRGESRPPIMGPAISLLADNKSGRTAMTSSALKATLLGGLAAFTITGSALAGPKVEVLHYWTSGGESKAVLELKKEFQAAGGTWEDSP